MMENSAFRNFLCREGAAEYAPPPYPAEVRLKAAAAMLNRSDAILIGAGAGLSTAAGIDYGGDFFAAHFADFRRKYGGAYMQDMYIAGFYPYPDEESLWGYWSRCALLAGIDLDVTPLYKTVLEAAARKPFFVLTTNIDMQFAKAGCPEERLFATQGDYAHIQCKRLCHPRTYPAEDLFRQMARECRDCRVPSELVPRCPVCGGPMDMNLRCDEHFAEDEAWHRADERFGEFLREALAPGRRLCLWELGVGGNTPVIIRYPFERLVREHPGVSLVRMGLTESDTALPRGFADRQISVAGSMAETLPALCAFMK